ncbi:TspO/MBR-related protein [Neolentinus lepideus HHB14362 ss-1]|uniref:TspO/MBR-related protein n=1 Tax=Neolentinus lepideus HHB14362 ss-1 TaxID=1314782 RepID=A0A165P153_9AGAM|nr:TspO/MBR-related protein [Neolentinus lepideus HHB14362 ss-1]
MSLFANLSNILFTIPRNPVTAVGLPLTLGLLSGRSTKDVTQTQWYHCLYTSPGRPPARVFPVVWPLLYVAMGYASHLAVKAYDSSASDAVRNEISLGLGLYYTQLACNCLWTPLFFDYKQIGWALVDSILLVGTSFYMTKTLDAPTASKTTYLLLPYCAWLSFATYLNGGIWWLNRNRTLNKNM